MLHELELLVRARYGLIVLETLEVDRTHALLRYLADKLGIAYFDWNRSAGLRRDGGEAGIYGTQEPSAALAHITSSGVEALYHLGEPGDLAAEPQLASALKEAALHLSRKKGAVVLSGESIKLTGSLRTLGATLRLPGPDPSEFRALIRDIIADVKARRHVRVELTPENLDQLLVHLKGLTLMEAEKVLTKAIVEDGLLSLDDIAAIADHKRSIVEREGLLEYYPVREGLDDIADLTTLKDWLAQRRRLLTEPERAKEYGLSFPRGVLLLGVPGCGKSLCAKAVARSWRLPLLKLDPSSLYSKYHGESEANFRRAMRTAEEMAPIVLWIDELEKAFASSASEHDGGTSKRIFGTFLSWMQERKGDVFIVATANDVQQLPPEMLRKGRFDEIFFVDLPTPEVRAEILRIHLEQRKQDAAAFNLSALAEKMEGFTGSEIEQAVVSALYAAFNTDTTLGQTHLEAEIAATRPIADTLREKIAALREWARERTRSAH